VDITTTAALYAFDEQERTQVSANLNLEFLNAAKVDHELTIEARINKIGKRMAYTEALIFEGE